MKRVTIAAGAMLVLLSSACTTYSDTLAQKLDGKNPEEKHVILAQECHEQIEEGFKSRRAGNASHLERMRTICEEMTGQPIPVEGLRAPE